MKLRRRTCGVIGLIAVLLGWGLWIRVFPKGRLELPAGSGTPKISMGWTHGVVLAPDGSLWSWGGEALGWPVLGRGDTNRPNFDPSLGPVGSGRDWVDVSAGQDHVLALKADGSLWGWGANYLGQLGNGLSGARGTNGFPMMEHRPVPAAPGTNWVRIEAGSVCSFGIQRDGSLWAWGENNFCQLGIGSWLRSPTPTRVGTATNWILVRQGGVSSGGIQSDGSVWIWGGSPATGNTVSLSATNLLVPTLFGKGTRWVDLAITFNLWAGVRADGTLWVWGRDAGAFAGSAAANVEVPTQIDTAADWQSVSASREDLLLRKRDGSWWLMIRSGGQGSGNLLGLRLPTDALAGDTTSGGVAVVTPDRHLWAWGTELGNRPATVKWATFAEDLLARCGWKVDLQPLNNRVVRHEPWMIRHQEPE